MSENTRKLLSFLMAVAMLLSMVPVGAVAQAEAGLATGAGMAEAVTPEAVPEVVPQETAPSATDPVAPSAGTVPSTVPPTVPPHESIVPDAEGTLALGTNTVSVTVAGSRVTYSFTPETTGVYDFYTTGPADTKACLYDAAGNWLEEDDDGGEDLNFMLSYQLTAGQTYYLQAFYWDDWMTGTMQVTVEKSPMVSISFTPVTVVEHTCGGIQSDWDWETESYQDYFAYGAAALLENSTFTATFADGTVITDSGTGFSYQDAWYSFDYSTNQGYTNQWTVGNTYEVDVEVMGYTAKVSVTVAPSPLVSLSFTPATVVENTNGYMTEYWVGGTVEAEYYIYYLESALGNSTYTATFSDGTVLTGKGSGLEYQGKWYSFDITADQSYENRWLTGNTYEMTVSIMSCTAKLPVTVTASPLVSLSFTPATVVENTHGTVREYWVGDTCQDEFYYYYLAELMYLTTYTATFSDGTVLTGSGNGLEYQGEWYSFDSVANQEYENRWLVGNTYEVAVSVLGQSATFPVTVVKNPLESLTFTPVTIKEGTEGYTAESWDDATQSWKKYYYYNIWDIMFQSTFTATFTDGTVLTGRNSGFDYNGEWQSFNYSAGQSYESRWLGGNTYEITVEVMGATAKIPVTIEKSPLVSLTFDTVTVTENTYGSVHQYWFDEQNYEDYFVYHTDQLMYCATYTATFDDGSELTGSGRYFTYQGIEYFFDYSADQSYENRWLAGNTYAIDVFVMGLETTVPVVVEAFPMESLTFEPITVTENTCGGTCGYWDEEAGEMREYYYYEPGELLRRTIFTATFSDNTVICQSGDGFYYKGQWFGFEIEEEQDQLHQWTAGNTYYITVSVAGYTVQVPVTIAEEPLQSISFAPITLVEGIDGYYINFNTQWEYFEYYAYETARATAFTATFDDGTVVNGTGDSFTYGGRTYYIEYTMDYANRQSWDNQWTAGNTYYITATVSGVSCQIPVTITASPLVSLTFEPISVMENTTGDTESGWNEDTGDAWGYFRYSEGLLLENATFTATFADGTVYTGSGRQFSYGGEWYEFETGTDQSYETPWTVGNTYHIRVAAWGKALNVPVTVTACPLESLTFTPVTVKENTNGYQSTWWIEDTQTEVEYYHYFENLLRQMSTFTATFTDGTVLTGSENGFTYGGVWYDFTLGSNQTGENPWVAGNTYELYVLVMGKTVSIPVTVVKSCEEGHTYTDNSDTDCNVCGEKAYPGGNTLAYEDGKWYHVVDRQKVSDTTLVYWGSAWYYVKDGVVNQSNTLCYWNNKWYHVNGGKVVYDTTLVYWGNAWYYVKDGVVNQSNTLCNWNGKWYHVSGGKVVYDTTLVSFAGDWYYVKSGVVDFSATTLCYFGSAWYYVKDGKVNYSNTLCSFGGKWYHVSGGKVVYDTTLVYFGSAWYYVKNGVLDYSNTLCSWNGKWYHVNGGKVVYDTTLVYFAGTWYYVKSGVLDYSNTLCNWNGKWYHVKNGTVVYDTTLVSFAGDWYYVKSGVVDFNSTTLCYFGSAWYYVKAGKVNYSNTLCSWNGKWYHVKNGTVVYDTTLVYFGSAWYYVKSGVVNYSNTLCSFSGKWYHVKNGTVAYDTTLVYFSGNWYYVANGVVNFNYSGRVLFSGSYYTVKNGVKV